MPNTPLHLTGSDQWFRYWMPYTFVKLEHARFKHVYLPLNRNYQPLGITRTREAVVREDFIGQALAFSQDPTGFKNVWTSDSGLYLYSDAPESRADYFSRLGRLMTHRSRLVEMAEKGAAV